MAIPPQRLRSPAPPGRRQLREAAPPLPPPGKARVPLPRRTRVPVKAYRIRSESRAVRRGSGPGRSVSVLKPSATPGTKRRPAKKGGSALPCRPDKSSGGGAAERWPESPRPETRHRAVAGDGGPAGQLGAERAPGGVHCRDPETESMRADLFPRTKAALVEMPARGRGAAGAKGGGVAPCPPGTPPNDLAKARRRAGARRPLAGICQRRICGRAAGLARIGGAACDGAGTA